MGRCLTQFWKLIIKWLVPNEMLKMTDLLDFVRDTIKQKSRTRKNEKGIWMEVDLVEMFPNIPRDEVEQALTFLHREIDEEDGENRLPEFFHCTWWYAPPGQLHPGGQSLVHVLHIPRRPGLHGLRHCM